MAKKIGIGIAIAVVVGLLLYFLWPSKKEVTFKTQVIEEGSISKSVSATGYLQPADKVEVGTQVSGKVEKLYVTYNSKVKKGQVLAELDKSTLLERLSQAKSQKSSAESTLNLATQNYNRTKALFEAGQLIAFRILLRGVHVTFAVHYFIVFPVDDRAAGDTHLY